MERQGFFAGSLFGRWCQEVLVGNEEVRESRIGYINEQAAAVDNWGSILFGMSGRHKEHCWVTPHDWWGRWGVDSPALVCDWLRTTSRGIDSHALLVCPVWRPSMLLWLEKALRWRDMESCRKKPLVMPKDGSRYQWHLLNSCHADQETKTSWIEITCPKSQSTCDDVSFHSLSLLPMTKAYHHTVDY